MTHQAPPDCGLQVYETPEELRYFRLASARAAMRLEKLGLRHSRLRGGLKKLWARHYNLPAKTDHDTLIKKMTEEMEELKQRIRLERAQHTLPLEP